MGPWTFKQWEIEPAGNIPYALSFYAQANGAVADAAIVVIDAEGSTSLPRATPADAGAAATSQGKLYVVVGGGASGDKIVCVPWRILRGVNGGAGTDGDPAWLSDTAGGWTATQPAAPSHHRRVGTILETSATVGVVLLDPQSYLSAEDLDDQILTPNVADALSYREDGTGDLYLRFVTSAGAERVRVDQGFDLNAILDQDVTLALEGADAQNIGVTLNHATNSFQGVDVVLTALAAGRTGGAASAYRAELVGDNNDTAGTTYVGLDVVHTDSAGSGVFVGMRVDAGGDILVDASAAATGESDFLLGANLASAMEWRDSTGVLARMDTTTGDLKFELPDGVDLSFGDSEDVDLRWDGVNLDMLALADDTQFYIGNGTESFDVRVYGNIPTAYLETDASSSVVGLVGPMRPSGFNRLSPRYELKWVAGQRGRPGLNAAITPASADDGVDGATAAELDLMNATDREFEILGVNASNDDVTYYAEGGIAMETDGADGDEVILVPHLNANQSQWEQVTWGTDKATQWSCHIQTGPNITDCIIWAGLKLTNTEVKATDADQVYFRYEDDVNGGVWEVVQTGAGGLVSTTTAAAATAINTEYYLRIEIDGASRVARCYLNGALVVTTVAMDDTTDLKPYIGVACDGVGAGAKALRVFGQTISRTIG